MWTGALSEVSCKYLARALCYVQLDIVDSILWRPHGFFHREPLDLAHLGVPHAPVEIGTMLTAAARALAV